MTSFYLSRTSDWQQNSVQEKINKMYKIVVQQLGHEYPGKLNKTLRICSHMYGGVLDSVTGVRLDDILVTAYIVDHIF